MEDGRQARFLFLPEGEDPDSLVRSRGTAAFEQLLSGAQPLGDYLFDNLSEGIDLNSLEGRARLSKLAAPMLNKLPDGVFKQLMLGSLANHTGISSQKLESLLHDAAPAPASSSTSTGASVSIAPPRQRPALPPRTEIHRNATLYAAGLLLLHPRLAKLAPSATQLEHLAGEDSTLLRDLLELLDKRPESNTNVLLGHWYSEPWRHHVEEAFNQVSLLLETRDQLNLAAEEGVECELSDTLKYLERSHIEQKLDTLFDKFQRTDYAELSPQEIQQLHRLLAEKNRK
jgi:DNA primase